MKATAYAEVGWGGQEVNRFEIPWTKSEPAKESIDIKAPIRDQHKTGYLRELRGYSYGDVKEVKLEGGILTIDVVPFTTMKGFTLVIGDDSFDSKDMEIKCKTADEKFTYHSEGDVRYRLYTPVLQGPRPLILFLHGGGNGGTKEGRDNNYHLTVDYGPVSFAENFPDMFVMAPQCIENGFPKSFSFNPSGAKFSTIQEDQEFGWCRSYLTEICTIIRRMISEGKVDSRRIYVTGLSMGGAGTIRMMSVGAGLFTACAPVCPTMTPETFNILRTMKAPVWVSTAYVDHTIYRHKYLVDAIMQLKEQGHKNAHLTIYSPEEMEKYDIGIDPDMSFQDRFTDNHRSWVLTYHNEYGIMSWLTNQVKE